LRRVLGIERWLLCGNSLGAVLTIRYALDYPERAIAQVFTNSMSAFADGAWPEQVSASIEAVARALEEHGRSALESLPMNPSRSRRLPAAAREALVADYRLHDPHGIARTFRHTVPGSPLGERISENRVPALLVAGRREAAFVPHRRRAEQSMPALAVVELDTGHAVNLEDASASTTRSRGSSRILPRSDSGRRRAALVGGLLGYVAQPKRAMSTTPRTSS